MSWLKAHKLNVQKLAVTVSRSSAFDQTVGVKVGDLPLQLALIFACLMLASEQAAVLSTFLQATSTLPGEE